jgi:hypothetical protein
MLRLIGEVLAISLGICAFLGIVWRALILPNLKTHLFDPVKDTRRQVTENKHKNRNPTVLDRIDDLENHIELVALNQLATLRRLGAHIGESEQDRARLWLMIESLTHEARRQPHDPP